MRNCRNKKKPPYPSLGPFGSAAMIVMIIIITVTTVIVNSTWRGQFAQQTGLHLENSRIAAKVSVVKCFNIVKSEYYLLSCVCFSGDFRRSVWFYRHVSSFYYVRGHFLQHEIVNNLSTKLSCNKVKPRYPLFGPFDSTAKIIIIIITMVIVIGHATTTAAQTHSTTLTLYTTRFGHFTK